MHGVNPPTAGQQVYTVTVAMTDRASCVSRKTNDCDPLP
jgi:hypothetical protein